MARAALWKARFGTPRSRVMSSESERRKVTLEWNAEDVGRAFASFTNPDGLPAKFIDLPRANYATWQYDSLLDGTGRTVGVSAYSCLSWNERAILSVAVVEPELAVEGASLTISDEGRQIDASVRIEPFHDPAGELLRS